MKKLLVLLFFFVHWNSSKGAHVWGADISYMAQGNGVYLITYDFYRDCAGNQAPPDVTLNVDNLCGIPFGGTFTMNLISSNEFYNNCAAGTTCQGGPFPGMQKYTYQTNITLPDTCSSWILGVSLSSRNTTLTTFSNPGNYNLYVEASINNTVSGDTSAVFRNNPVLQVCRNQPVCIDPGLFDAQGDSLVASFIVPRTDYNGSLQYDSGYSLSFPMQLNAPLSIDPVTGQFCFTALGTDYTQLAIRILMYRNGKLLGSVQRDVGLNIITCANEQPTLTGINNTEAADTFVCANSQLCFSLSSIPYTAGDSTYINWDSNIPSASFTTHPAQNQVAEFCWTPGTAEVSSTPYCFTVHVKDNNCYPPQSNSKTYCITVFDSVGCLFAGIKNLSQDEIEISPQPANDFVRIKFSENEKTIITLSDIMGNKLFEKQLVPVNNEYIIPVEQLPSDIYLLTFKNQNSNKQFSKKILIIKSP
jgi:hypothetical protein